MRIKNFITIAILILGFNNIGKTTSNELNRISSINWREIKTNNNKIIWEYIDKNIESKNYENKSEISSNKSLENKIITAMGNAVKIDGDLYPEISSYVPNAFIEDEEKFIFLTIRGLNSTRNCASIDRLKCSDAIIFSDINIFQSSNSSFNINWAMQSLSSRDQGTKFGEGQTLGFKSAFKLSDKWHLAFGGDNIILLDKNSDLGRNMYLIAGTFYPINNSYIFLNAGIGSDFFGYRGNGFLGRTSCLGTPNLTGEGQNTCTWGPIGSFSIALNERFALVNEWFGYGYGSGISIKPFKNRTLNLSIYATDYLQNFPSYIQKSCKNKSCETRFYANFSLSI